MPWCSDACRLTVHTVQKLVKSRPDTQTQKQHRTRGGWSCRGFGKGVGPRGGQGAFGLVRKN